MKTALRFPITSAAAVLAMAILLAALIGHIDIVALNVALIERIEPREVDDIVVGLVLVFIGLIVDHASAVRRERQERAVKAQRQRVFKATMASVQDIVNNFLNSLQLVRMEAEGRLPPESLALFDDLIQDTSAKIRALGNIVDPHLTPIAIGEGIDYSNPQ